jgi:uncharacterized membrane protein
MLRLIFLDRKSIWFDEAYSAYVASMSPVEIMIHTGRLDNHPPLFYLILHFLVIDKFNEFHLRLPSAVFGALTVLFTYTLGRSVANSKVGLISASLVAFSPLHIFYSQEARMYSLLCLSVTSSLSFMYIGLKTDTIHSWIGYSLSTLIGLYTHYFAFLPLFTQIIYNVSAKKLRSFYVPPSYFKATLISLIGYIPWIPFVSLRSIGVEIGFPFHPYDLLRLFNRFTIFGLVPAPIRLLILFIFASIILYSLYLIATRPDLNLIGLVFAFSAIPIVILLGLIGIHIWQIKYFVFLLPIYLIFIGYGISHLNRRKVILILITSIITFSLIAVYPTYSESQQDWRSAANYVKCNHRSGDKIVFDPEYNSLPFNYYFKRSFQRDRPTDNWTRMWLVTGDPENSILKTQFDKLYEEIAQAQFKNVYIFLYVKRENP